MKLLVSWSLLLGMSLLGCQCTNPQVGGGQDAGGAGAASGSGNNGASQQGEDGGATSQAGASSSQGTSNGTSQQHQGGVDAGFCTGSGPGIIVGESDAGAICAGNLAQTTFRFGVCVCEDMALASVFTTDGYNSSQGPYMAGQPGGSVGVNGTYRNVAVSDIGGSMFAGQDVRPIGAHEFKGELHVGGSAAAAGNIKVRHDAYVANNINGFIWTLDQTLHIPAAGMVGVGVSSAMVQREPVTVAPPCACNPADLVDISGFIQAHQTDNENGLIGLTTNAWSNVNGAVDVTLPCGRYYVDNVDARSKFVLRASGRTALYVAGDLKTLGVFRVELEGPDSELDLFIGGNLILAGVLDLGDAAVASRIRTYVAGSGDIALGGDLHLGGNLYAPNAKLAAAGPLEVFGAIFVRNMAEAGVVKVHYDRDVLSAGNTCEDPTRSDAGIPGHSCNTCQDCGNQACVSGVCGECHKNDDCCAPLVCNGGVCDVIGG